MNCTETADEPAHYLFGMQCLIGKVEKPSMQRMPITSINAVSSYMLQKLRIEKSKATRLLLRRIPSVIVGAILAILVFIWASQLYGTVSGLGALLLFIFSPNIIAHSRLVTSDIYSIFFCLLSLYWFTQYLKDDNLRHLIYLSVATAFAQISKQTSLLLFVVYFLVIIALAIYKRKNFISGNLLKVFKKKFLHLFLFFSIIFFVINLAYKFHNSPVKLKQCYNTYDSVFAKYTDESIVLKIASTSNVISEIPLPLPSVYVETYLLGTYYNLSGDGHLPIYMLGKKNQLGWKYYYIVALFFKLPVALIALLIIRIFVGAKLRFENNMGEIVLLTFVVVVLLFFNLLCTAQIGIRYVIIIVPCLLILISKVFSPDVLKNKYIKYPVVLFTIYFVASSISYYPHYISYFNEFIGNRKNMYKYLADSNVEWDQDKNYLFDYIEKNKNSPLQLYIDNNDKTKSLYHDLSKYSNLILDAEELKPGKVIISVNRLVGLKLSDQADIYFIKNICNRLEPTDRIAYSYLIYYISQEDINEILCIDKVLSET